jgi:hypothetical protein
MLQYISSPEEFPDFDPHISFIKVFRKIIRTGKLKMQFHQPGPKQNFQTLPYLLPHIKCSKYDSPGAGSLAPNARKAPKQNNKGSSIGHTLSVAPTASECHGVVFLRVGLFPPP